MGSNRKLLLHLIKEPVSALSWKNGHCLGLAWVQLLLVLGILNESSLFLSHTHLYQDATALY